LSPLRVEHLHGDVHDSHSSTSQVVSMTHWKLEDDDDDDIDEDDDMDEDDEEDDDEDDEEEETWQCGAA
jgi:hypothetical protein